MAFNSPTLKENVQKISKKNGAGDSGATISSCLLAQTG
jgi:hypothetical protein